MLLKALYVASLALVAIASTAEANLSKQVGATAQRVSGHAAMPPSGYKSQWWTHPIGCEYSRAGRPGEIVWYLIINTVRPGCPTHIVQRGFKDVY